MASYSLIFSIEFFFKNLKKKFEVGQTVVELDIQLSTLDIKVSKPGIPHCYSLTKISKDVELIEGFAILMELR